MNGKPIVQLPDKSIVTTELEFTEEENTVYRSFESKVILRIIYHESENMNSKINHYLLCLLNKRCLIIIVGKRNNLTIPEKRNTSLKLGACICSYDAVTSALLSSRTLACAMEGIFT